MKHIMIILFLSIFLIGCACESSGLSRQDRAIQNKDWRECKKASLSDVCLLGYAKALNDRSVCHMIRDEDFRDMCDEVPCGYPNGPCCFEEGRTDWCESSSFCFEGNCRSCGVWGKPACMIDGGLRCYEGHIDEDTQLCEK